MTDEQGYNGWTNYPTWNLKLWIDNDQGTQEYWLAVAREEDYARFNVEQRLKEEISEYLPSMGIELSGFFADCWQWMLDQVNWLEVAESLIEDAKEIPA